MPAVHNRVQTAATVSASGSSPVFSTQGHKRFMLTVIINATPTGTTPTITYKVMVSSDGISFAQKGPALTTLSAVGSQRTLYGPGTTQGAITENFARVDWTVTGTTPSFTAVSSTFHSLDC